MLKIRLQRVGRKHEPTFRVVLTDSKNSTKSGRFHELLGSYDPRKKTEAFDGERIKMWMSQGAQLTGTVHNLLVSHKIIEGKKINVLPYKKPFKSDAKVAAEKAEADAKVAKVAEDKAAKEVEEKAAIEPIAEVAPVSEPEVVEEATPSEVTAELVENPEMKDEAVSAAELPVTPEESIRSTEA